MITDVDLLFHCRKRHLAPSLLPWRLQTLRQRRFHPYALPTHFFAPPPEVNSTDFRMGIFLSRLAGCMPRDAGLGLFNGSVGASQDSRDLRVVTRDDVESGRVLERRIVEDPRKVARRAAPPPGEKRDHFWKKAHEKTKQYDKRLGELEVDLRLYEERLYEQRKSAEVPKEDLSELFIPLTAQEEKEVHDCLHSAGSSGKVLVLHESSNIEVSREKFRCLRAGGWLNDEVINLYLELLRERGIREPKRFLKCHFFNTFFYKKLACGKNCYDYKSVKRWTTRRRLGYDLIECDKIFVPVHKSSHWCLAIINMKQKSYQYLDSLGGTDRHVLTVLAKYIEEEVKDKSNTEINISYWREELVDNIPLQQNSWDCGMFMLKYIDFHSRGLDLSFSQENMPYFRNRTAKEILRLKAD